MITGPCEYCGYSGDLTEDEATYCCREAMKLEKRKEIESQPGYPNDIRYSASMRILNILSERWDDAARDVVPMPPGTWRKLSEGTISDAIRGHAK
jgi:hypothetical protein